MSRPLFLLLTALALSASAAALPVSVTLKNIRHEYQGPDNCAPVTALTISGYYGTRVTQVAAAAAMKDYSGDPQVSSLELAAYLGEFGLRSVIRYAGTPEVLRELVSRGFPVVVQQRLKSGSNVAHFRTVYGYSGNSFLLSDPLRGPSLHLSSAELTELWRYYNGEYLVAYPPARENEVRAALGENFNATTNWRSAQRLGERDVKARPSDPYAWWGLAKATLRLGDAERAAELFNRAINLGVPTIYYLYRQEAFEAWTQTGWYTKTLQITRRALDAFPKSKELLRFHDLAEGALEE